MVFDFNATGEACCVYIECLFGFGCVCEAVDKVCNEYRWLKVLFDGMCGMVFDVGELQQRLIDVKWRVVDMLVIVAVEQVTKAAR